VTWHFKLRRKWEETLRNSPNGDSWVLEELESSAYGYRSHQPTMSGPTALRRAWGWFLRRIWIALAILGMAAGFLLLYQQARNLGTPHCPFVPQRSIEVAGKAGAAASGKASTLFTLKPNSDSLDVVLPNVHTLTRTITFTPLKPLPRYARHVVAGVEGDLVRTDKGAIFSEDQMKVATHVSPDGQLVTVRVCFNREFPYRVDPGQYEGTFLVRGPGLRPTTIPVIASVRYPNGWLVHIVAFATVLLALFAKALSDVAKLRPELAGGSQALSPAEERRTRKKQARVALRQELRDYAKEPLFIVSAIVGLGIAWYAVFTIYLSSSTFGTPGDWIKLVTFCFGSVVGGMTATDFAAALGQRRGASG
jgi:hypothetical protein